MSENANTRITKMLEDNNTFLFMKGDATFPQCGFSARAVALLNEVGANFSTFNVLEDEDIRQGVKEFGNWPTIPQLYHNKELVGGSDILMEMYESGELKTLLTN